MIHFDISDAAIDALFRHQLSGRHPPTAKRIFVTDRVAAGGDVLIIGHSPVAAARAVHAVLAGTTFAVLRCDQPERLPFAVAAIERGWVSLPRDVRDAATRVKDLGHRELAAVDAALAGRPLRSEAATLGVSEATVKRALRVALQALDIPDRRGLHTLEPTTNIPWNE